MLLIISKFAVYLALLQKLSKFLNCEQPFGSRPRSRQVKDAGRVQGFSVSMSGDKLYFGVGYKRLCLLIRVEGTKVNHKRVYSIYRDLNPAVRKRGRLKYHWSRRTPK